MYAHLELSDPRHVQLHLAPPLDVQMDFVEYIIEVEVEGIKA